MLVKKMFVKVVEALRNKMKIEVISFFVVNETVFPKSNKKNSCGNHTSTIQRILERKIITFSKID